MNKPFIVFPLLAALLFSTCWPTPLTAQDETADKPAKEAAENVEGKEVLAALQGRIIKALGGQEALEKFSNRVTTSTVKIIAQGMEAELVTFLDKNGSYRESMALEGFGDFIQGISGDVTWALDPINGPRLVTGAEKVQLRRGARLHTALWLTKDYLSAKVIGEEKINDQQCEIFDLVTTDGKTEKYWVSEKGLVCKMTMTADSQMGKIPMEIILESWKEIDGIQYPEHIKVKQALQMMEIHLGKIEHDVEDTSAMMAMPEKVQKLVDMEKSKKEKVLDPDNGASKGSEG